MEIDEHRFVLDKTDVWNIYTLAETAFNKMLDYSKFYEMNETLIKAAVELEGAYASKVNRKVVMEKCEKLAKFHN